MNFARSLKVLRRLRNVAETGEARQLERDKSLAPGKSDGGVRRRDQLMESRLGREIAPLVEDRGSPHRVEDVPVEAGEESVSVLAGNSLPDDPELDPVRSFPVRRTIWFPNGSSAPRPESDKRASRLGIWSGPLGGVRFRRTSSSRTSPAHSRLFFRLSFG